jgi:molybdopterin-guanine dinucleotide biosynthesis protein A
MGMPKALVLWGAVPLWRHQLATLESLGPAERMISAGTDWDPGDGPWTVVRDRTPGLGPLGGIDAGLRAMRTEFLLVLAVDMPFMSAAFLREFVAMCDPSGVVPGAKGFYSGMVAAYPRSLLPLAEELLRGRDRSIRCFNDRALEMGRVVARPIAESESSLFKNLNSAADVAG